MDTKERLEGLAEDLRIREKHPAYRCGVRDMLEYSIGVLIDPQQLGRVELHATRWSTLAAHAANLKLSEHESISETGRKTLEMMASVERLTSTDSEIPE